jgi:hypothetical protein
MNYLHTHKGHLASILVVFLLFIGSIYARQDRLALPISPNGDWITAHTLITCEIWDEAGGPQAFNFNPVYTYPGGGSKAIAAFGGVMDEKRDQYYVSYPPLAFIYAYYATQLFGGPDVYSLRTSNLILHFFCTLLLYLIVRKLSGVPPDSISFGALFAAFLYLFSAGMLWMHGMIYFSDMLVQLFLMTSIFLFIRLLQNDYKKEWSLIVLIAISTFLGCYTEWLALFWAFFSGLFLLILYFKKKKKIYLKTFFAIGITAALTLGFTIYQYSSIAGFDKLKESSLAKYEERSGFAEEIPGLMQFTIRDWESWQYMFGFFKVNYVMLLQFVVILVIGLLPILIWNRTKLELGQNKLKLAILLLITLSVGLHYILFFNFNAIHNFSNLKTGFVLIMAISLLVVIVERHLKTISRLTLVATIFTLGLVKANQEQKRFEEIYHLGLYDTERIFTAESIKKHRDPDRFIFINVPPSAELHYMSKHISFPVHDSTQIKGFMNFFETNKAQYYHHNGDTLDYMVNITLVNDRLIKENYTKF